LNEHLNDRNSKSQREINSQNSKIHVKTTLRRSGQSAVFNLPDEDDGSTTNLPLCWISCRTRQSNKQNKQTKMNESTHSYTFACHLTKLMEIN